MENSKSNETVSTQQLQNLITTSRDPASIFKSVLHEGPKTTPSAAQRAMGMLDIASLIASHTGQSEFSKPDILKLMHVNRAWRAAAQPFLLRELDLSLDRDGWSTVWWDDSVWVPLEALLRDGAHLFHYTTSLTYTGYTGEMHLDAAVSAFELPTRCPNLRRLDLDCGSITAWSRLMDRPLVSFPCLEYLAISGDIELLPLIPWNIPSMSNLKEIKLHLKETEGGRTIGTPRSIDWLSRLFVACSKSLTGLTIEFELEHEMTAREFVELWSAIRPHLKHITRLSMDLELSGATVAIPLDDLPESLQRLSFIGGSQTVQSLAECLRDPRYLPHLVAAPRLEIFGWASLSEGLSKQVIRGLKARKGLKWMAGEEFMDIPMDFDREAGQDILDEAIVRGNRWRAASV